MLWAGWERKAAVLCGMGAHTADLEEIEMLAKINPNAKKPQKMYTVCRWGGGFVLSWMFTVALRSVTLPTPTLHWQEDRCSCVSCWRWRE